MTIDIPTAVARYLDLVARATSGDQVAALYSPGATVEDPVGSTVLQGSRQIAAFYDALTSRERSAELLSVRVAGNEAAFHFRFRSGDGERTSVIEPIDVMTFDEDGLITSMRAFWSRSDVRLA
ncbi:MULTISPECIES: nuclear transport factor 2 family protein [unclassified Nocardioides]|uniref:nuclear transport factor 2 family protein n=1 Tax=unclassified Nocardioides TaxID=2615069 RepID=UPI000703A7E3|nr:MULTISPECIES: nuclear transport factor 2 family protein [unclassified Nocardioides]KRC52707.1 hypothetical protein ASE19_09760 [Nocardioides sp. Root79]KRC72239.1 hypothetical protein ASE20_06295 [Nocardioides sp. Root240]